MKPLNLSQPHLIITVGIPGSGKSTFADQFANTFNAPLISLDKLPANSRTANDTTLKYFMSEVFKTGRTVVLDTDTRTKNSRVDIAKFATSHGYQPLFVWIQIDEATAKRRFIKPIIGKNSNTVEHFTQLLAKFTKPNANEKAIVISGKHTYPSQLKIVLKHLVSDRTTINEAPRR